MNKYLYFQDGNNDAYCYPLERFIGFKHAADTTLLMQFKPLTDDASEIDLVTLTITTQKEKDAIKDIVAKINAHPNGDPFITIADNVNQEYASAHISDLAGTLDS